MSNTLQIGLTFLKWKEDLYTCGKMFKKGHNIRTCNRRRRQKKITLQCLMENCIHINAAFMLYI